MARMSGDFIIPLFGEVDFYWTSGVNVYLTSGAGRGDFLLDLKRRAGASAPLAFLA